MKYRKLQRRNPSLMDALQEASSRRKPEHCLICGEPTRHGKKYCSEHIEHLDYVSSLQERVAAHEAEPLRIKQVGPAAIQPDSLVLRDIIAILYENGPTNILAMAKHAELDEDTLQIYADYLVRSGRAEWVTVDLKKRGPTPHLMLTSAAAVVEPPVRDVGSAEVAEHYGLKPGTVFTWVKKGAPHTRHKNKFYFNLEELEAWQAKHKAKVTRKFREDRKRLRGKINVKEFNEPLWADLEKDFHAGMRLQHLREKYHVGLKRIMRYIEERGLARKKRAPSRRTTFPEPFWDLLEQDYLSGMPITEMLAKYHIDKKILDRFIEHKNLSRPSLHLRDFDEPFWEDVEREYMSGTALRSLRDKYHTSEARLNRFIQERGLPVRERGGFPEDFWPQLAADRAAGMSVQNLQKKYKVGKKRINAYLAQPSAGRRYGRRRRNPGDRDLRELERRAATGGEQEQRDYLQALYRAGGYHVPKRKEIKDILRRQRRRKGRGGEIWYPRIMGPYAENTLPINRASELQHPSEISEWGGNDVSWATGLNIAQPGDVFEANAYYLIRSGDMSLRDVETLEVPSQVYWDGNHYWGPPPNFVRYRRRLRGRR